MSLRADMYRQKAAEARQSAARAKSQSIKQAFEEVANGWDVLAEQTEWIHRQKATSEETNHTEFRERITTPDLAQQRCPRLQRHHDYVGGCRLRDSLLPFKFRLSA